eukprot:c3614_g1_i1 orf=220-387(+)
MKIPYFIDHNVKGRKISGYTNTEETESREVIINCNNETPKQMVLSHYLIQHPECQ